MSDKSSQLVNKALELLKEKSYNTDSKYSHLQLSEIIHELDVYQAELEVQNHELSIKEELLIKSNKEFEILFYDAPVPYIVINTKGEIVKYNQECVKIFDLLIVRSTNLISLVKTNQYKDYFDWINSNNDNNNEIIFDLKVKKDFEKFKIISKPYTDDNSHKLLMLFNVQELYDLIDSNKKLDEEKRLREKLLFNESRVTGIGEMLSNVAHQWRQPLNLISILITTVKYSLEKNQIDREQFIDQLTKASENVVYLSNVIDNFKSYYQPTYINPITFNINEVFTDLKNLTYNELETEGIKLIIESDDIYIFNSKTYLFEILINLVKNSLNAFKNNETKNPVIIINTNKIDDMLEINLKDNAGGMDEEILSKVFEPYYSTKFPSIGVGLGLYIVFELIAKHFKGTVEASNISFKYNKSKHKGVNIKLNFSTNR